MKNIAIILAGGMGSRFNPEIPKQFAKVAGKTIIEHTIEVFQNNEIEDIISSSNYNKVRKILVGGAERKDSSLSAINSYKDSKENINLIFHDAVRPFITNKIITNCIQSLEHYDAVDVSNSTRSKKLMKLLKKTLILLPQMIAVS